MRLALLTVAFMYDGGQVDNGVDIAAVDGMNALFFVFWNIDHLLSGKKIGRNELSLPAPPFGFGFVDVFSYSPVEP